MDDPAVCLECAAAASPWWHIFDTSPYLTRDHCGDFPPFMLTAWFIASIGLFVLYTTIAVLEVGVWRRLRRSHAGFPHSSLLWIAAFFLGCGGGHLMNALAFRWPMYRAFVIWDWYTLITSIVGVYGVWRVAKWKVESVTFAAVRDEALRQRDDAGIENVRLRAELKVANSRILLLEAQVKS